MLRSEIYAVDGERSWPWAAIGGPHLRRDARVLFQRHSRDEPKAIGHGETAFATVVFGVRPPFVRRESGQEKHRQAHGHVGHEHQAPDAGRQGIQESEQFGRFVTRDLCDGNEIKKKK